MSYETGLIIIALCTGFTFGVTYCIVVSGIIRRWK